MSKPCLSVSAHTAASADRSGYRLVNPVRATVSRFHTYSGGAAYQHTIPSRSSQWSEITRFMIWSFSRLYELLKPSDTTSKDRKTPSKFGWTTETLSISRQNRNFPNNRLDGPCICPISSSLLYTNWEHITNQMLCPAGQIIKREWCMIMKSGDTLRRRYTRESATLLHVLGSRGDIPISPPKLLCVRSLTDKVSMYEVDRR